MQLRLPSHQPKVGERWPITLLARTGAGKSVDGTVSYAFLFAGRVVASRPGGEMRKGLFHDSLLFPSRAVGVPLILRVILKTPRQTGTVDQQVTVEPLTHS
jgi:hypothetical protein